MSLFRKKPVVIEAYQFHNRIGTDTRPHWIVDAATDGKVTVHQPRAAPAYMLIKTLEGEMRADVDDWIIQGVKGELYPCKPDIFEATYDVADQGACKARSGSTGANDPQDCDWPVCGCDPHADKVIAALEESGLLRSSHAGNDRAPTSQAGRASEVRAAVSLEEVEMVDWSSGYQERADSIWRVTVDGYCADFQTETAATNFRNAIIQLIHGGTEGRASEAGDAA